MEEVKRGMKIDRRSFLKTVSLCSCAYLFQPLAFGSNDQQNMLRFGLIADVHQDIMHDSPQRITAFAAAMDEAKADFICQLGDFCIPLERNRDFFKCWEQFEGPRYHVLGNHDMDEGFTQDQAVAYYKMPGKHYAFDAKGVHFIVLNDNEPGGKSEGYKRYISKEQLSWLSEILQQTQLPTIVFSHQALDAASEIENCAEVRKTLEQAENKAGQKKVVACFCGHHHDDQLNEINGIKYVRINSASYLGLGEKYKHESYSKEIHQKHPSIAYTAPYKDPLWALVEIDLTKHTLTIKGKCTTWFGPSPWELGMDKKWMDPKVFVPRISDRAFSFWHK